METAPLYTDIAEGPENGAAYWLQARDGTRLRIAHWPAANDAKPAGTVLLFPGRTEYVEKFGRTAADLAAMGYATLTIDWRGQGLSDRGPCNPMMGYVKDFAEFQVDIAAMMQAVDVLNLPKPLYLLSHSMGGCIALRALHEGLPVKAAMFSAPMWGILMAPHLRPFAWVSSFLSHHLTKGCQLAPGTKIETYVKDSPFEDNSLTSDPDTYAYMQRQAKAQADLTLGGPSLGWLYAALTETRALARMPAPDTKIVTFLGTNERIVDPRPVHKQMSRWGTAGHLEMVEGAEHEILMEQPATRARLNAQLKTLFS